MVGGGDPYWIAGMNWLILFVSDIGGSYNYDFTYLSILQYL